MSNEVAVSIISGLFVLLSALVGLSVKRAGTVVRNTEPVFNGFAAGVRADLLYIRARVDQLTATDADLTTRVTVLETQVNERKVS